MIAIYVTSVILNDSRFYPNLKTLALDENLKVRNVALKTLENIIKIMNEKKVVAPASVGSSKENAL